MPAASGTCRAGLGKRRSYASYVRALPKPFQKFPPDLSWDKLHILIEEGKVTFSSENVAFLIEDTDTQYLFVEKNIDRYLEIESECTPDDDFRGGLLSRDISDEKRLIIIKAMDLTLLASTPSRAAKVGPVLIRTGADVSEFGADAAVVIIVNSRPINVQIPLLNKFQRNLDDQQVRSILGSLPEPYSEIKPGYGTPRIKGTEANLEFVKWLEARRFISSWSQGGLFGLDDDIRINLRRK
ncbi:MAG: hypothetical protein KJ872_07840 [Alphaproteobacteria bacterium]|nr:hypothetical protein [Alphaproteobacteria bacterium]